MIIKGAGSTVHDSFVGTFSLTVFFVLLAFFRNCIKDPEVMYSVMNTSCVCVCVCVWRRRGGMYMHEAIANHLSTISWCTNYSTRPCTMGKLSNILLYAQTLQDIHIVRGTEKI